MSDEKSVLANTTFDPSVEPTQHEVEARQSRETQERLAEVDQGEVSEVLLARIEPEGRDLYAINQSLEKALLLSIAISLCTSVAVDPIVQSGASDADDDEDDGVWRDKTESNRASKAKPVRGKVGKLLEARAGTLRGKVSKGRDDKSKGSASAGGSGVRHWDKPPNRKGKR